MLPVVLLLLLSHEVKGSITETLFVQTGKDLLLDVKEPVVLEEGGDLIWKFNGSTKIAKLPFGGETFIFKSYTGRAELFAQNHSLLLKNVTKIDSGDYTAVVSGENDQPVAKYKVTVQDPVSPVNLTVNSSSSESCNLTVTCSTVDAHISSTFRCDRQTCSEEGGERSEDTTRPSSITVYLEQGIIICNHSNHVSWKQETKEIKSFCNPPNPDSLTLSNGAIAAIVTGLCLCVTGTLLFINYRKRQKGQNKTDNGNTGYADPEKILSTQTSNHNPQEDSGGPTSTYCMVNFHTGPEQSNKPKHTPLPETIYAQVNRAEKTNRRSPSDQDPELEKPHTVYSVCG